jgi:hypothetical protein
MAYIILCIILKYTILKFNENIIKDITLFGFSLLVREEVVVIRDEVGVELSSTLFLVVACPVEEDDDDSKRGNISTLTDF